MFLQVIEECLSRYEPWQVCVSFTGGKDCSALLHIIYAVWQKLYSGHRLQAMYIFGTDPFAEMEQFIEDTRQRQVAVHLFLFSSLFSICSLRLFVV